MEGSALVWVLDPLEGAPLQRILVLALWRRGSATDADEALIISISIIIGLLTITAFCIGTMVGGYFTARIFRQIMDENLEHFDRGYKREQDINVSLVERLSALIPHKAPEQDSSWESPF